jgi:hypothetical protein
MVNVMQHKKEEPDYSIFTAEEARALKATVALLQAQVLSLLHPDAPCPRPMPEGASVYRPAPASRFVVPSTAELTALLELVFAHLPDMRPKDWTDENKQRDYVAGFGRAMLWINSVGRQAEPNKDHYLGHWHDKAVDWLHERGAPRDVSGFNGLMAAAIVSGVAYVLLAAADGIMPGLGLANFAEPAPGDDQIWRKTLGLSILPAPFVRRSGWKNDMPIPQPRIIKADGTSY